MLITQLFDSDEDCLKFGEQFLNFRNGKQARHLTLPSMQNHATLTTKIKDHPQYLKNAKFIYLPSYFLLVYIKCVVI